MESAKNILVKPLPNNLGISRDDRFISRYAGDGASEAKIREAAKLMSIAADNLCDDDGADALEPSEQALAIFRELKNSVGAADALRFVALAKNSAGDKAGAEKTAKEAISEFEVAKDARGQAILTLALAEVAMDKRSRDTVANEEALSFARTALASLQSAKDLAMEVFAHIAVATVEVARKHPKEALKAASKGVELAESIGDMLGLAKATHCLGEANVSNEEIGNVKNGIKMGIQAFKNSLAIYQELDAKLLHAYELRDTAELMLKRLFKPTAVDTLAREAMNLFKLRNKHKSAASCLQIIVHASIKYKAFESAGKDAFEGVLYFKKVGAQKELAQAWILMTETHIAEDKGSTAVEAISNAVKISEELDDSALKLAIFKVKGRAECSAGAFQSASSTLAEAKALATSMQDKCEEVAVLACIVNACIAEGDVEGSIQAADDQREIFQLLKMTRDEANALLTSAKCIADKTFDSTQVQRALSRAREAQELAMKAADAKAEGAALLLMAKLSHFLEKDDEAIDAASKVLEILKHAPEADQAQGEACMEMARTYMEVGNFADAVKTADQASAFAKKSEDPMFDAEIMIGVSEVYYGIAIRNDRGTKQGMNSFHKYATKAFQTAKLAKARCDRFKFRSLLPKALCAVGETGISFDVSLALTSAEEAEKIFRELDDDVGVATAVILQANILYHKGSNSAAKSKAEQGMSLAEQAGAAALAAEAADVLDQVFVQPESKAETTAAVTDTPIDAGAAASGAVAVAKPSLDPEKVKEQLLKVLEQSLAGDEDVEPDTPLMDAGLDSLASVAFRNALQSELGMQMPASLIFDYPNVRQITDFIVEKSAS